MAPGPIVGPTGRQSPKELWKEEQRPQRRQSPKKRATGRKSPRKLLEEEPVGRRESTNLGLCRGEVHSQRQPPQVGLCIPTVARIDKAEEEERERIHREKAEERAKGKGAKGDKGAEAKGQAEEWLAENPNRRWRSAEALAKGKGTGKKGEGKPVVEYGENLPEHLQHIVDAFGPGGASSGSGATPKVDLRPSDHPSTEAETRERSRSRDDPPRSEGKGSATPKAVAGHARRITVYPSTTRLAEARVARGAIGSEAALGSNYRQRSAAAQEAVAQARARGTVATAIAARVYQADGIDEACSSCDERKTRQRSAVHRFASSVVAKFQARARARRRVPVALRPRRQRPPGAFERSQETEPEAEGPPPKPKAQEPKAAGPPAKAGERTYYIGRNLTLVNPTPEQFWNKLNGSLSRKKPLDEGRGRPKTKRPERKEKRREPLRKRLNGRGRSQRPKPQQNLLGLQF